MCFPVSGQAVVTGVVPSPPPLAFNFFIAHRVQQSHCSSIFHRVLLTHALALSASQFVDKKKSPRTYTCMHWGALELTKTGYRERLKSGSAVLIEILGAPLSQATRIRSKARATIEVHHFLS